MGRTLDLNLRYRSRVARACPPGEDMPVWASRVGAVGWHGMLWYPWPLGPWVSSITPDNTNRTAGDAYSWY